MPVHELLEALRDTSWATAIRENDLLFPVIESVHVLAITFVVGMIAMLDLRLLGFTARHRGVAQLTTETLPWTWGGFVVAVITGSLMFASAATKYYDNTPFRIKAVLLVLAGVNMLIYHLVTERSIEHWGNQASPPPLAKVAGALSLIFWFGVIAAGRWIGFTDPGS